MAIKDSIDFDYAIKQITKELRPEIIYQDKIMESGKLNRTFSEIETSLNTLYEKTRYVEDAIEYAKIFLDTKIRDFDAEITSIMEEIEDVTDITKNSAYYTYNVPLKENILKIKHSNETLMPLINQNKSLVLSAEEETIYDFTSLLKQTDSIAFDDNVKKAPFDKKYYSIYLEEKIMPNGLTETITVHFNDPKPINSLNLKPVNCTVSNIKFGLVNGYEEIVKKLEDVDKSTRICNYIKFDLTCVNYETVIYEIDLNKSSDDAWGSLKYFELEKIGRASTKIDREFLMTEHILSRSTINKTTNERDTIVYRNAEAEADLMTLHMYSYIFSLEVMEFKYSEMNVEGYFESEPIHIGRLGEKEYINISTKHTVDTNSSIEYSIIDGEREIPIMRIEDSIVYNERIYSNKDTRFNRAMNTATPGYIPEVVKKNGLVINESFESVSSKKDLDGRYSITYKPAKNNYDYVPLNPEIKIRAYVRTYEKNPRLSPSIEMITIRKYGEDTVWINKY